MENWPIGLFHWLVDGAIVAAVVWHVGWGRKQDAARLARLRQAQATSGATAGAQAGAAARTSIAAGGERPERPTVRRGRDGSAGSRGPARRSSA